MALRVAAILAALALGGQAQAWDPHVLKAPTKPVLSADGNTVAHVFWKKGALSDAKGNAWTMLGTVPQVAGKPAGAGPLSAGAYYQLTAQPDALDVAGDYTAIVVFNPGTATDGTLLVSANPLTAGWGLLVAGLSDWRVFDGAAGGFTVHYAGGSGPILASTVNVICFGRGGSTLYGKINLGTMTSTALTSAITPATSTPATIGSPATALGSSMAATHYEVLVTTTAPSDGLCAAAASAVKAKYGITAW
jgi:hypothetical protein